jgi:hypothetical protein
MNEKYLGNDNYGKPKKDYLTKLETLTDEQLLKETEDKIWLSAYAGNNLKSDYHWQCDACYDECSKRNKLDMYEQAWKQASNN